MDTTLNWLGFSVSVELIGICEEGFSKFPV
jgi:hypothetical protein